MNDTLLMSSGWMLPMLLGVGLWSLLTGAPRTLTQWCSALGYGYLFGLFACAEATALWAARDTTTALARLSPWLLLVALLIWGAAAWCWRKCSVMDNVENNTSIYVRGGCLALLLLLAWHGWLLLDEILLRPTFPWDAWSAWAVKPKTWYLLGHASPFVSMHDWLANPGIDLRTTATWGYPELLAWVQVWCANAAGGWSEPLVNLAWFGLWLALLLACYGQWRVLGSSVGHAMVATYALGSLPLLNAHVALAGYADLWLATVFGLAVLCWLRWLYRREYGQLIAAILLGLAMPALKLEGAVWLICFLVVLVLGLLPQRWRWWIACTAVVSATIGIAVGGFMLPVLGLGWVKIAWGEVDVPSLGILSLHWRAVGQATLESLYTLPNWNLLWFVLPGVLVWRWRVLGRDAGLRQLAALLSLCALFLFVLFFFTDASRWAENFTSVNRLILHITPVVVTFLVLLLRDAHWHPPSDTVPASAPLPQSV